MNHRIKAKLLVVATVLAAASSGLTGTAHAEGPGPSDVLVASGCLDLDQPVALVGGGGSFSGPVACNAPFNLVPSACAIVSDGDPVVPEAGLCGLSFGGDYVNTVCGTGIAGGSVVLTEPDGSSETIVFSVSFVAGQGVLTGTSSTDDGTDTWAGYVNIVPTGGDCATGVTQFRYTAAAVAVDGG
jgi:hypothetical protein